MASVTVRCSTTASKVRNCLSSTGRSAFRAALRARRPAVPPSHPLRPGYAFGWAERTVRLGRSIIPRLPYDS